MISTKWFFVLATLLFSSWAFSDTLTLHFYPSPHGINWQSPGRLARSTLVNLVTEKDEDFKHAIGHATIELKCEATSQREAIHIYRGTSSAYSPQTRLLLTKENYGLGILFFDLDGRLEKNEDIEDELNQRLELGRNSFVEYDISSSTCQRLYDYSVEYEARKYHEHYGLPNRPRYGEGAGCSAFVVSYLSVAGLLEPEYYQAWSKKVRVPTRLIGGHYTNKDVPLMQLLLTPRRWAKKDSDHFELFFWDPDKMHRWVKRTHARGGTYQGLPFEKTQYGKSKGLRLDVSNVPTPTDPFFYGQEYNVTANEF